MAYTYWWKSAAYFFLTMGDLCCFFIYPFGVVSFLHLTLNFGILFIGLWHFWVFLVGSPWESNFFDFEMKIFHKKEKEEISYRWVKFQINT
jgi:hypothetical protein